MRKKEAIKILNKQIKKLQTNPENTRYSWKIETHTYIVKFFGESSKQAEYINNISWTNSWTTPEKVVINVISFLNDCINTIETIGLYKEKRQNFLTTLPDWVVSLIFPGLISVGLIIGKYTSDLQNIELKRKIEQLEQRGGSSPTFITTSSDTIPNNSEKSVKNPE